MKKGLIGIMVLACVALISGTALAATFWSVDVEGTVEWTIIDQDGLMPDAGGTGPALVIPVLSITAGPWEAATGVDPDTFAATNGYIKYTADMGSITLNNEVGYDIFDLGTDITPAQGITLATEVAPLSLDAVYTAGSEYGLGATYDAGVATLGVAYNSTGAWGGQLVTSIDILTITITSGVDGTSANAYGLLLEAGMISLGYDVDFASAYTLTGELSDLALTESTLLGVVITNTAAGTKIAATATTALADAVDLITALTSPAGGGTIEYSSKIVVEF